MSSADGESIVGSLANKQPAKAGPAPGLIVAGVVVAVVGLIMRVVARSQANSIAADPMFGYPAEKIVNDAATLGNVGLGFLIVGGALVFLGALAAIIRR